MLRIKLRHFLEIYKPVMLRALLLLKLTLMVSLLYKYFLKSSTVNEPEPIPLDQGREVLEILQGKCTLSAEEQSPSSQASLTAIGLKMAREHFESEPRGTTTTQEKRQILIISYYRDGSSFLGEIINAIPHTFYHFEPLYLQTKAEQVKTNEEISKALTLIRSLVHCEMKQISLYHSWAGRCMATIRYNLPKLLQCHIRASLCYDAEFLSQWCSMHSIQVLKVLRLKDVKILFEEFPKLQIVYLARDPRGIYNSRLRLSWCNITESCIQPKAFCSDMRQDFSSSKELQWRYPYRFMQMRYEDLALDTKNAVKRLIDFLQVPPSNNVDDFIGNHTRAENHENFIYSTFRDSKTVPHSWKKKLSATDIAHVEFSCSDVITQLGFQLMTSQ